MPVTLSSSLTTPVTYQVPRVSGGEDSARVRRDPPGAASAGDEPPRRSAPTVSLDRPGGRVEAAVATYLSIQYSTASAPQGALASVDVLV